MAIIKDLRGREILDSRGNPTVACEVLLDDGTYAVGYAPSGVAAGAGEALELRDKDPLRYNGMGVLNAVNNINTTIRTALLGMEVSDLARIDQKMIFIDGTPNKSKLGANSTLAVSLACAKAGAKTKRMPLYKHLAEMMGKNIDKLTMPIPFMNILNGGKHAIGSTDFQEFMIVPTNFKNIRDSLRAGAEVFHALGKILKERNYQPLVGDEGGYAPALFSNEQALELLMMAISEANYEAGKDIFIALDPAASRFYSEDGFYELYRENKSLTNTQLVDYYVMISEKYPIISIEDPLAHSDWHGWRDLTQKIGDKIEIIGDDIYSTNFELLKRGITEKASTGILIKPNQIGTLTETFSTIKTAEDAGFKVMISHRSGETEDSFIADLAIASGCGCIKAGAPCRSERTAKYNRLLEIEDKNLEHSSLGKWDTSNNGGLAQL